MYIVMIPCMIVPLVLSYIYMEWFRKTGDASWRHALQHVVAEIKSIFKE